MNRAALAFALALTLWCAAATCGLASILAALARDYRQAALLLLLASLLYLGSRAAARRR